MLIISAKDKRLSRIAKRAFLAGIEVTNDCFEVGYDDNNPSCSWVKVFLRDADKRYMLDPVTKEPKWRLMHGEVTMEPPIEELRKILEGAKTS